MANDDSGWGRRNAGDAGGDERNAANGPSGGSNPQDQGSPWGKPRRGAQRDQDGPPDLDQLWEDCSNWLRRTFGLGEQRGGRRGAGGDGGGSGPSLGLPGVSAIAGALSVLWLLSGVYIVEEGQVSVVTQFGGYRHTAGPGIQWRLPYPFQAHETVNTSQVRKVDIGFRGDVKSKVSNESLMLTGDENIIDMQFAVQYRIKNPVEFLFNNRNAEDAVLQAAETSMREAVGRSKMDFVLYEGREQIATQAAQMMQQVLDRYKVGISISSVTIQGAQPPDQVQAAFDDAVKAGQDRERLKNEGQAYANDVIPKARGTAARLLQEAEGYKQRVIAQAEGEASRFKAVQSEYAKAPVVTRERLYLDTMQQVLTNASKIVADSKQANQLLYLPFDKLLATAGADSSAAKAGVAAAAGAELPVESGKARTSLPDTGRSDARLESRTDGRMDPRVEALRSRDRDSR